MMYSPGPVCCVLFGSFYTIREFRVQLLENWGLHYSESIDVSDIGISCIDSMVTHFVPVSDIDCITK